jgi:hypothetical protein
MIALQYNELTISITMRPIQQLFQVRDVFDVKNNFPHIQPDFNQPQFNMYQFLQTPVFDLSNPTKYPWPITTNTWNADIHLLSTYCFLTGEESRRFAAEDQVYLVKDVFEYTFNNITGSQRVKLTSSGMVANWMMYLQRNDVNMRNEWSNYTNWPYQNLPYDIYLAPPYTTDPDGEQVLGPGDNLPKASQLSTGIFITGDLAIENQKEILETMAIVLNGDYRENVLESGIYNLVEKYVRTKGSAKDGLYVYNFCLNTDPLEYQPSGAINLSKFRTIELEVTTYVPPFDTQNSEFNILPDSNGNPIVITKNNWRLYEYNYNMKVFEERYNILSFVGGNCGMLYAR